MWQKGFFLMEERERLSVAAIDGAILGFVREE